jgi:putative tryptophan/tyrosine transport system substrate-binding protein
VLVPGTEMLANSRTAAIRQGLREAGLVEGVNYALAVRYADGVFDRLPGLALELAALKPRVIIASAAAAVAVHKTVPGLPMIFTSYAADPIKAGFAQSYERPGGNTTGNVMNAVGGEEGLTQKRMGSFKQLVPGLKRLAFIGTATSTLAIEELEALHKVAGALGSRSCIIRSKGSMTSRAPSLRASGTGRTPFTCRVNRCSTPTWRACCRRSWRRASRRSAPIPTGRAPDC